jgi:hypothetical protein
MLAVPGRITLGISREAQESMRLLTTFMGGHSLPGETDGNGQSAEFPSSCRE